MKVRYYHHLLIAMAAVLTTSCGQPSNIKVIHESARELFPATMDGAYLSHLERWTANAARARLAQTYDRNGVPPTARTSEPRLRSRYLEMESVRLAVIEITYTGSPVRVTRVTGLVGGELITVSCTSPQGAPRTLTDHDDECGRQVREIFVR